MPAANMGFCALCKHGLTLLTSAFCPLSASVPAGQAPLGFCLLSFTFISLFISGWGRTQQLSLPAAIPDRWWQF